MNLQGKRVTIHDMSLREDAPQAPSDSLAQMKPSPPGSMCESTARRGNGDGPGGLPINHGLPAHTDEEYSAVVPKLGFTKVRRPTPNRTVDYSAWPPIAA
jgi:4-hydroxy-2-oxovalerate/4-hydroxy-2-oxohexanoate aldolase